MGRQGYASGVKRRARAYVCYRGRMCFGRDATPWFGRLLTDKRLHHFSSVFVLKCCINVLPFWHFRSVTQKREPPLPPFSMLWFHAGRGRLFLVRFVFVHSFLITRASSNIKSSGERGGSVCHLDVCVVAFFILVVQSFVLQPLRSFGCCNMLAIFHSNHVTF